MSETMEQVANKHSKKTPPPAADTAITAPPPAGDTALTELSFEGDAGQGFQLQTMADRKIPLLVVLQAQSPQVLESKGTVRPGQLFNTVTGEVFDEVHVVPAITDHCWLQFIPRDDGGGFRGRHPADSKTVAAAIAKHGKAIGKIPIPGAKDPKTGKEEPMNELVETFEIYAITYDPKTNAATGFVVIPMSSSKISEYKEWNTRLTYFAPKIGAKQFSIGEIPMFAHRVKITSDIDKNAKGTFFIAKLAGANGNEDLIKSMIGQNDPRYQAAKKLCGEVARGLARVAYETMKQDAPAGAGGIDEDSIPF